MRERKTGRTLQLGSSCLRPYIGLESPENAIRRAQLAAQAHAAVASVARATSIPGEDYIDVQTFLAHVVHVIRRHGFQASGETNATWRAALDLLDEGVSPSRKDLDRASTIRQWAPQLKVNESDGYRARLVACLARDRLTSRELPLAASGVRAYNRQLYWQIRRERAAHERG